MNDIINSTYRNMMIVISIIRTSRMLLIMHYRKTNYILQETLVWVKGISQYLRYKTWCILHPYVNNDLFIYLFYQKQWFISFLLNFLVSQYSMQKIHTHTLLIQHSSTTLGILTMYHSQLPFLPSKNLKKKYAIRKKGGT